MTASAAVGEAVEGARREKERREHAAQLLRRAGVLLGRFEERNQRGWREVEPELLTALRQLQAAVPNSDDDQALARGVRTPQQGVDHLFDRLLPALITAHLKELGMHWMTYAEEQELEPGDAGWTDPEACAAPGGFR